MDTPRSLTFTVQGVPVAQPRLAQVWAGGKRVAYVPRTRLGQEHPVTAFKTLARARCREALTGGPFRGPLGLRVVFVLHRPRRLKSGPREWCPVKPDLDNLLKATKDSLKGLIWNDDAQVVMCDGVKVYASSDEEPHTEVTVWEETVKPVE